MLALSELDLISNPVGGRPETILWCWVLMNACQATCSPNPNPNPDPNPSSNPNSNPNPSPDPNPNPNPNPSPDPNPNPNPNPNASQATWSILFARGQLLLSAFALGGIAASLV